MVFLLPTDQTQILAISKFLSQSNTRTSVVFVFDLYRIIKKDRETIERDLQRNLATRLKIIYTGYIYDIPYEGNLVHKIINNRIDGGTLNLENVHIHLTALTDLVSTLGNSLVEPLEPDITNRISHCISYPDVPLDSVVKLIHEYIPTAYGMVDFSFHKNVQCGERDMPVVVPNNFSSGLHEGLVRIITNLQSNVHSDIKVKSDPEDFVFNNERLIRRLFGSSASHLLLLESNHRQFVRKIAVRGGVEGNGFPKLNAEIQFLHFLEQQESLHGLRELYPKVLRSNVTDIYSLLDLEYIGNGKNVGSRLAEKT